MNIDQDILIAWGGVSKRYSKGEYIFHEGDCSRFYYKIIEGKLKLYNLNDEGKLFTQGVFKDGNSFGEPPLFINERYPSNAIAVENSIIIRLLKETFLKILNENPRMLSSMNNEFARRLFNKANTSKNIISQNPEHRIISFLNDTIPSVNSSKDRKKVPYTRQEIADFTGLRVETVIRTTKKLSENNILEIRDHKLYY